MGDVMLGPVDIADWRVDECDRLRAEIRILPIAQNLAANLRGADAALDDELATRWRRFARDADQPAQDLRMLLDGLRRAQRAR